MAAGRATWLDAARIGATLAVISIHIYGVAFIEAPVGSGEWWVANGLYASAFWAVPVFVMASGALLLGVSRPPLEFYRRRALKIVPAIVLFVPLYMVFAVLFQDAPSTPQDVARALASGRPYNHLYFLSVIAGLYAVTPLLARGLEGASRRFVWGAAIGLVAMAATDLVLGFAAGAGIAPTAVTWWIPFVGYFVLGYAIATADFRVRPGWLGLVTLVAIVSGYAFVGWTYAYGSTDFKAYMGNYLAIHVIVTSACIFAAFRAADAGLQSLGRPLAFLSSLTFGVYLGHLLVASALFQVLSPQHTVVGLTPVFVGTVLLSFVIAAGVARIPVLRRFIGL